MYIVGAFLPVLYRVRLGNISLQHPDTHPARDASRVSSVKLSMTWACPFWFQTNLRTATAYRRLETLSTGTLYWYSRLPFQAKIDVAQRIVLEYAPHIRLLVFLRCE